MYLQPYNNPLLGLQKKLHNSTFNLSALASTTTPMSSRNATPQPPTMMPRPGHMNPLSSRSRSLADLLEPRAPHVHGANTRMPATATGPLGEEGEGAGGAVPGGSRKSSISTGSAETDFSFSSSGSSDAEAQTQTQQQGTTAREASPVQAQVVAAASRPDTPASSGGGPSTSRSSSPAGGINGGGGGGGGNSSPTARTPALAVAAATAAAPRVPPRPQAQEIFARCTTYTRKAAMASRARLMPQQMQIPTR